MDAISKDSRVIQVIGLTGGWRHMDEPVLAELLGTADLLVGGRRQLSLFPEFKGQTLAITANIPEVASKLQHAVNGGRQVVVLASGDPLCYGIGATLRRYFTAEQLHFRPAVSAFQLAFAALGESWHDACLTSAHGRQRQRALVDVITHTKTGILTDGHNSPSTIALHLLEMGVAPEARCAVCEQLGGEKQHINSLTIAEAAAQTFDALNVMVVWNDHPRRPISPGLADDQFTTERQQITKREARLVALAEIGLQPYETMWDIGSGSGSVAIEAARSQPTAQLIGFEKSAVMCGHWRKNAEQHGAFNAALVEGAAPDSISGFLKQNTNNQPDAIFIGGSGGRLSQILDMAIEQLASNGRLVATFATLENYQLACQKLPQAYAYQLQVNRVRPIANLTRLEAQNPIFIVRWDKRNSSS